VIFSSDAADRRTPETGQASIAGFAAPGSGEAPRSGRAWRGGVEPE
jgi:hypothetical protein